jgi:putative ABC transport system permease protein
MRRLNAWSLSLAALGHKPLSTVLNLILMTMGIGMMTFIFSVSSQIERRASRDAEDIDLVVGAKGSPFQLIMSSVFHIDIPTGNIPLEEQAVVRANPLVAQVIPLALGDSYQGFRIVGTDVSYPEHFHASLGEGAMFNAPMEAVFGAQAARESGARVGATFAGSHGLTQGGELHNHAPYRIVGILRPTGTVLDRLVLTPVASVWRVHESDPDEPHDPAAQQHREVTALLVKYRSPLAAVSLPRWINSRPQLQSAQPALESARLFKLVGVGADVLRAIAAAILVIAALSMFVALYNALEERQADLAILRALGAAPGKVLRLLLVQGCLLALGGALLGWLAGHAAVAVVRGWMAEDQDFALNAWALLPQEALLPVLALAIGCAAAVIPAWRAYRIDIAKTLAR